MAECQQTSISTRSKQSTDNNKTPKIIFNKKKNEFAKEIYLGCYSQKLITRKGVNNTAAGNLKIQNQNSTPTITLASITPLKIYLSSHPSTIQRSAISQSAAGLRQRTKRTLGQIFVYSYHTRVQNDQKILVVLYYV